MEELHSDADLGLYERDFWAWTNEQASLLRSGRLADADIANIAEELETLGRREISELGSRLAVLIAHLLKEIVQPQRAGRSWASTIIVQRQEIARHMRLNPGLKSRQNSIFAEAYEDAISRAAAETGLPKNSVPSGAFTLKQALDPDFWPGRSVDDRGHGAEETTR